MSQQLLGSVVMLAFFACFVKSQRWMLAMYILSFSIPLDWGFYTFFEGYNGKSTADLRLAFIDFTFIMLVISGIITRGSLVGKSSVLRTNEFFFLIGYFLFSLLSLFWAGNSMLVIAEIFILLKILIVFFYFSRNSRFVYNNINYVIYGVLGIAVIQFVFSILQVTTGQLINFNYLLGYELDPFIDSSLYRYGYRALGTMGPGETALMSGVSLLLGLSLTIIPTSSKIKRLGYIIALLSGTTLLLTQSRNFIGATAISSFFMLFLGRKPGRKLIKLTVIAVIPLLIATWSYNSGSVNSYEMAAADLGRAYMVRSLLNKNAIDIIRENPTNTLIGVGQNNYLEYQNDKSGLYLTERMRELPVHNVFLLEFSETGLIGAFLIIGFFALIVCHVYNYGKSHDPMRRSFRVFLSSFWIFCIIAGYFSWAFFNMRSFCFAILAISLCVLRYHEPKKFDQHYNRLP